MSFLTLPRREIWGNSQHSKVVIKPLQMRSVTRLPLQTVKSLMLILMTTIMDTHQLGIGPSNTVNTKSRPSPATVWKPTIFGKLSTISPKKVT
ncbi:hypothetical protein K503DRAFT_256098 [Rhizopogon vinicolor AM-OR11-026]|uniref:Uncharacterized protein n=1 Tax=Rhizopogon vinicolor AM-OR11-026 TaxID=1314800 RepID=A0A1B7MWW3_9AGAM|nr:hypothetical protein K503DRAFT_256098 [Rhizopogon vinicolor AM-OR11-026]